MEWVNLTKFQENYHFKVTDLTIIDLALLNIDSGTDVFFVFLFSFSHFNRHIQGYLTICHSRWEER